MTPVRQHKQAVIYHQLRSAASLMLQHRLPHNAASLVYPRGSEELPTQQEVDTAIANMKVGVPNRLATCGHTRPSGQHAHRPGQAKRFKRCEKVPDRLPAGPPHLAFLPPLLILNQPIRAALQAAAQPSKSCCTALLPYVQSRCPCDL